jgi:uncharacterized membrane protein YvbJ
MPKFCPNCGESISDKVKFCPECGVVIDSLIQKIDQSQVIEDNTQKKRLMIKKLKIRIIRNKKLKVLKKSPF